MRHRVTMAALSLLLAAALPHVAGATARLTAVTPVNGGCVFGPTGPNVEAWDVAPGSTYTVRLEGVTDRANGGTDATMNVLMMNSTIGNIPLTATKVSTGVYEFTYTVPANTCDTTPIRYGTVGGNTPNTGLVVGRHDNGTAQSHLRAADFSAGCSHPVTIACVTAAAQSTWGALKTIYR